MNRAARRAAAKGKGRVVKAPPRVHKSIMMADGLPTPGQSRITSQKLVLLSGIGDLKAGTFGYNQLCNFHDFIALALRFCDYFKDERLRPAAEACAAALTGIMERHIDTGRYGASGDELRALQEWVEEITDYLAQFPEMALKSLMAECQAEELEVRMRIAFNQSGARAGNRKEKP